jgi:hypothetical protein
MLIEKAELNLSDSKFIYSFSKSLLFHDFSCDRLSNKRRGCLTFPWDCLLTGRLLFRRFPDLFRRPHGCISSLILREVEIKQVNWSAHDTDILLTEHIKEFLPNGFHGFDKSRMSDVLIYIFAITSPSLNVDSCQTCNPIINMTVHYTYRSTCMNHYYSFIWSSFLMFPSSSVKILNLIKFSSFSVASCTFLSICVCII